jgi:hypothetical protein
VRGARLPRRLRAGRTTAHRRRLRARAAAGPAGGDRLPEPIFTPSTKAAHRRARREHHRATGCDCRRRALAEAERSPSPSTGAAADWARRAGDPRGHEVRARARRRRRAGAGGRGADARLLALLAGRLATARRLAAELRQAVTCATGSRRSTGTRRAPGPELPDDVAAGTAARYREAYESLTGPASPATSTRDGSATVR